MGRRIQKNPFTVLMLFFFFFLQSLLPQFSAANYTIAKGQAITDEQTLISPNEIFELGFFNLRNSSLRYLGIWYNKIQPRTVVWVANRENPIPDRTGVLKIEENGNLVVSDGKNKLFWSSNARKIESSNTTGALTNAGNFVLSDSDNSFYWQSFDHPTDTFLPGMRVRVNSRTGENRAFVSWKSEEDPSPGNYSMGVDPSGAPQIVIWDENKSRKWRSGQWNSAIFTGIPNMSLLTNYLYGFKLSSPPEEDGSVFFTYVPSESSVLLRFRINYNGTEEELRWDEEKKEWSLFQSQPTNDCENYNHCGKFAVCNTMETNKCSCVDGYQPRFPESWSRQNWTGGCKRKTDLNCERNGSVSDGFLNLRSMKLPDFETVVRLSRSESCREMCLKNCSCNAYAEVGGIGCMIWEVDLVDIYHFASGGNLLHIRVADSELGQETSKDTSNLVIIIPVVVGIFLLGILVFFLWRFKNKLKDSCCKNSSITILETTKSTETSAGFSGSASDIVLEGNHGNGSELPIFNFNALAIATNNFSPENELGHGGFGLVYKGKLPCGQEIAVKRLSVKSGQGTEEFKNEIILIAKLQHRNLVRLLGCCIDGEEKLLVYEYMPNKSLDFFIFDEKKQALLDWKLRFEIIEGIARGLLYLHRDSRLRIIHRDLKTSNILLDEDMNPKISDFGMARIFGGNQNEANTIRVVGTYGYMSPEYAMEGLFSVKSDVYSFGVLLLEIVSGRKNTSFRSTEHGSLINYTWHLWNQKRALELVDPTVRGSCLRAEALRCIQVGMLCVQDSALDRPNMASVLLMLESQTAVLSHPTRPTFTSSGRNSIDVNFVLDSSQDLTATVVTGR